MAGQTEDNIDFLLGQVHALTAMVQALLIAHPAPDVVREVFEVQLLRTEANTLSTPLRDAYLDGVRAVQAKLYVAGTNPAER